MSGVDPASLTYLSSWRESGEVPLTDGVFSEAAPGSAAEFVVNLSECRAINQGEGKEIGAVILVTQAVGRNSLLCWHRFCWRADLNCKCTPLSIGKDLSRRGQSISDVVSQKSKVVC